MAEMFQQDWRLRGSPEKFQLQSPIGIVKVKSVFVELALIKDTYTAGL